MIGIYGGSGTACCWWHFLLRPADARDSDDMNTKNVRALKRCRILERPIAIKITPINYTTVEL